MPREAAQLEIRDPDPRIILLKSNRDDAMAIIEIKTAIKAER
jgi:hypothetical protein